MSIAVVWTPFARYWSSTFLADFGDGVRLAAFPLLAAETTSSPAAVTAVTAVQGLPWLALGLGIGVVVDRYDLRKIMVGVDVARALLIAGLAIGVIMGAAGLPLIYATAFLTGAGAVARDMAAATATPRLADPQRLARANGRLVAGRLVGNELAGPAMGGWLFGIAAALPFAVNVGGLGVAVLLLLTLPSVFAARPRDRDVRSRLRAAVSDIRSGLTSLLRDLPLRNLVFTVGLVAAADGAFMAILVLYVTELLGRDPATYGVLLGVGAVGGITAGVGTACVTARVGIRTMLSATVVVMAAAQLALGLTTNIAITGAGLFCSGAAFGAFNAISLSVRQRRAPSEMLGRVNSIYMTVGRSAEALSALAGGALAAALGIQASILAGIVPLLGAAVLIAFMSWNHRGELPSE